jgi:hypothetical protein
MSNDSSNSLLTRAWRGALVLFGTVVLLWVSVAILVRIWVWLLVIALAMVIAGALWSVFTRRRDRNLW